MLFSEGFPSDISHIDATEDSFYILCANKVYAYNRYGSVFEKSDTAYTAITQEGGYRRVFALDDKKHLIVTSEGAYTVSPEILADNESEETEDTQIIEDTVNENG